MSSDVNVGQEHDSSKGKTENDVNANLEQTINKTLQWKSDATVEYKTKKSLLPEPIYNSNYDLNDNTSNDFQSVKNRNPMESNEILNDANGAVALDTSLQPMRIDKKSISIKNRSNDSPCNVRSVSNKRQTNNINDSFQAYCSNDRQQQRLNSKSAFENVRPMKTQCETYCKCCTSSNSDSLIMQHSIASFKLCCTHGKHCMSCVFLFFFPPLISVFRFAFILALCMYLLVSFSAICHFSFPKPSQPA